MKLKSLFDLRQLLPESPEPPAAADASTHSGRRSIVRLSLETKGRKGKSVTVVSGLQHNPATMKERASVLKEHCGTGGTVKNGTIELQGDQRVPASAKLGAMNYIVRS